MASLSTLFLLALVLGQDPPPPPAPPAPDYSGLASRYRESRGLKELPSDQSALATALDRNYALLELGAFEVRYPWHALADSKRGDELKLLLLGLVDVQGRWLQWLDEREYPAKQQPPLPAELTAVRQWIAGWKMDAIRKGSASGDASRSLVAIGGANDAVTAALKGFAEGMRNGSLARVDAKAQPTRLILAATRNEFVGITAFVGSLDPEWKAMLWTPALPARVEFHSNDILCLALEHADAALSDAGMDMNRNEKTGQIEHVTTYAADRLLRQQCGSNLDAGVHVGLAIDLVIDVLGQNNSRVAGSGEGNSTPERSKFVRGGKSSGGKLKKISADSRWRVGLGKDWFVEALRNAQKEGGKVLEESGSLPNFVLDNVKEPGTHDVITAPFLGGAAASKEIAPAFFADYQEFLRAYRACFVHWLKTDAKSKAEPPVAKPFAELLRTSLPNPALPFEDRVTAYFGVPLSAPDAKAESLEGQFLLWLSKQK